MKANYILNNQPLQQWNSGPWTAVIIFPMLARGVFRVCEWSVTQVLVFHFVREPLSVPLSSYLTRKLVNKQPG